MNSSSESTSPVLLVCVFESCLIFFVPFGVSLLRLRKENTEFFHYCQTIVKRLGALPL